MQYLFYCITAAQDPIDLLHFRQIKPSVKGLFALATIKSDT
jgi:hypothetical protein